MKYLVVFTCLILITACSSTDTVRQDDDKLVVQNKAPLQSSKNICLEAEVLAGDGQKHDPQDCETDHKEGVAELIHPLEPIKVPLPKTPSINTDVPSDIWDYIAQNLSLEIPENQSRLDAQKAWYLKHPTYMRRVANRARPFLHYIVEQLESQDIPLDIALLPIVESGFDPFAYSPGRAAGMWQFIPESGKRFGMPQNWWYDGRRDVIASTQGAINYLKFLHGMFDGNWMHALAAYNSGEGRVQRAIRKNQRKGKPTDFWSLDLPRETRAYVPKLLALADILRHGDKYNFKWPSIDNAPVLEVVDVGSQIDLAMAAEMAQLSLAELQALNPGYNQWATDPHGTHTMLLPIDKTEAFLQALSQVPPKERLRWERHKVRSGESIGKIASMYETTVNVIKSINELNSNTIYAGDYLLVPIALTDLSAYSLSTAQNSYHAGRSNESKVKITYTVRSGDSLWEIARDYGVSVSQLSRWNRMSKNDTLNVGKQLVVWTKNTGDSSANKRSLKYKVKKGDSLSEIANKFNVKVNDIVRWNALSKRAYLQPGQQLTLKVNVTQS